MPETSTARPEPADKLGEGGTILVVDDEHGVRMAARTILEEFGFNVITASCGKEGLDVFCDWLGSKVRAKMASA